MPDTTMNPMSQVVENVEIEFDTEGRVVKTVTTTTHYQAEDANG